MKKLITLIMTALLALSCVFGLTACGGQTVKIGSQTGTTGAMYAECLKGCELSTYDSFALAAQDLKNGRIEYVIVDGATAESIMKDIKGLKKNNVALSSEFYGIAVDKAQPELLESINGILAAKEAEINAIIEKYMNGEEASYVPVTSAVKNDAAPETQLVVATNAEFKPWEAVNVDGTYFGIEMEVAKIIADELNLELVIEDMKFESVVTSIGTHSIDVGMSGLTITAERKKVVNFTNSFYTESQYVLTLESNTSLDDCMTIMDVLNVLTANK